MSHNQYQTDFLSPRPIILELNDADIRFDSFFYSQEEGLFLYQYLLKHIDWQQETIQVYGKSHLTPRLSCWMGDENTAYGYSNTIMQPTPWNDQVLAIKQKIERATNQSFNSVLINYYRDGKDSNGWHSDNEPELGANPVIASLSFGAPRDFHLRHKANKQFTHKMSLTNGSLLMMSGTTQQYWQHHIPKRAKAEGRINLTFRTIINR